MSSTPQNGAELLARIRPTLPTLSTQICLPTSEGRDLMKEHEAANTALAEARSEGVAGTRMVGARRTQDADAGPDVRKLAKKVQAIEAEIEANSITFTFEAMPNSKYRDLCDKHPPRDGNQMDQYVGYDREAVEDDLVRACLIDPVFDDESWAQFLAVCNPSEWKELRETVAAVNRAVTAVPKSRLASQILDKRAAASKRRVAGE